MSPQTPNIKANITKPVILMMSMEFAPMLWRLDYGVGDMT
mgnify:CR=1 FL=1